MPAAFAVSSSLCAANHRTVSAGLVSGTPPLSGLSGLLPKNRETADDLLGQSGGRSYRLIGAITGFIVGAGVTWVVVHQGGSTSLCDRSANQDALNSLECAGLVVLGGAVGAGLGAVIGGAIRSDQRQPGPFDGLRITPLPGRDRRLLVYLTL